MQIKILNELISYDKSMSWFANLEQTNNKDCEKIFIFEYENIYTAGKSIKESINIINNTPVYYTNRGGLWTWHGEGQLMIYFIYNLKKRHQSLDDWFNIIEPIFINLIKDEIQNCRYNVYADKDKRGFWVEDIKAKRISKIGFIGLRISNGFLTYGMSINYNNDLSAFNYINPCGLGDVKITSISEINRKKTNLSSFKLKVYNKLLSAFL